MSDDLIFLDIAAGERHYEDGRGWKHNDVRPLPGIDYVCDATDELLSVVGEGSCREIRALHCLEHFSYTKTVDVLRCWRKLLAPGGRIHIEVPNLQWQINSFYTGLLTAEEFVYYAYGEQNYPENSHFAAFTSDLLRDKIAEAGFNDVNIIDIGAVLIGTAKA